MVVIPMSRPPTIGWIAIAASTPLSTCRAGTSTKHKRITSSGTYRAMVSVKVLTDPLNVKRCLIRPSFCTEQSPPYRTSSTIVSLRLRYLALTLELLYVSWGKHYMYTSRFKRRHASYESTITAQSPRTYPDDVLKKNVVFVFCTAAWVSLPHASC